MRVYGRIMRVGAYMGLTGIFGQLENFRSWQLGPILHPADGVSEAAIKYLESIFLGHAQRPKLRSKKKRLSLKLYVTI